MWPGRHSSPTPIPKPSTMPMPGETFPKENCLEKPLLDILNIFLICQLLNKPRLQWILHLRHVFIRSCTVCIKVEVAQLTRFSSRVESKLFCFLPVLLDGKFLPALSGCSNCIIRYFFPKNRCFPTGQQCMRKVNPSQKELACAQDPRAEWWDFTCSLLSPETELCHIMHTHQERSKGGRHSSSRKSFYKLDLLNHLNRMQYLEISFPFILGN